MVGIVLRGNIEFYEGLLLLADEEMKKTKEDFNLDFVYHGSRGVA